jgi:hypothetical protein
MFDVLFAYPKVRARHEAGPAAEERKRYLLYRARDEGIARSTLVRIARELLVVANWINERSQKRPLVQEVQSGAAHNPDLRELRSPRRHAREPAARIG